MALWGVRERGIKGDLTFSAWEAKRMMIREVVSLIQMRNARGEARFPREIGDDLDF